MQAKRGASLNHSDPDDRTAPTPSEDATLASRRRHRTCLLLFAGIAACAYAVDVVTKVLAVEALAGEAPVQLVGRYLTLYLARNPGAAFSTGTSYTIALSLVAVTAAFAIFWFARRLGSTGWAIGLGFLLAGVLGNLTDRVFRSPGPLRGHVVDFLMLPNFPVFNFADVWINIAAATIILQALRGVRVDGRRHDGTGETGS